ncbi:MAG: sulfatase-like hydrolase/transferase, partial [bacterium]|nr:sulfatase-like hydrolase/transferase [bacterium]
MRSAGFETAAFVGTVVLERESGLARGFDTYDDQMPPRWGKSALRRAERSATAVVDAVDAWMNTAPDRFFLWVHLYDPHAPYDPPPQYAREFPSDPYAGEIAFVDAELGRLLERMNERWPDERTLVAVTSDHGESMFDHGEPTHSYGIYDSTQWVPLLMQGPGLPQGRVVKELVRLIDVAPTVLALSNAESLPGAAGHSLLPLVEGVPEPNRIAYLETLGTQLDMGWSPLFGIRTERHKYIRAPRPELYDLLHDPSETRNLAADAEGLTQEFDAILETRLADARPARPNLTPSDQKKAQLESLGYVLSTEPASSEALGVTGGIDPKDEMGSLTALGNAYGLIDEKRPKEALAILEDAGDGFAVRLARITAALAAGDSSLTEREARAAIDSTPDSAKGHSYLGMALERQERLTEAEEAHQEAVRIAPGLCESLLGLGRIAEARGRTTEAGEFYARAWESHAPEAEAGWRLAAVWMEQGRGEEADALLAGIPDSELAPANIAVHLATAERRGGRLPDALKRIWGARRAHPRNADLALEHGRLLEAGGSLERALAARERALVLAPKDLAARNDVAWSLARLGQDLDRALSLAEGAVGQHGAVPELLDTLATVRLQRGDWEQALEIAERGTPGAREETRAHLLYIQAEALAHGGPKGRARDALKRALDAAGQAQDAAGQLPDAAGQPPPFWHDAALALARTLGSDGTSPPDEVDR